MKQKLVINSLFNSISSLGIIGTYLAKGFNKMPEYDVYLKAWEESQIKDPELIQLVQKKCPEDKIDISIKNSDPYGCLDIQGKLKIACIYYDNKIIKPKIIKQINEKIDVLVVPSFFTKNRFEKFGITIPIKIVPWGYNPELFQFPTFPEYKKVFTFISFGEHSFRKGTDILMKAFCEEFKPTENVKLKLISTGIPLLKGLADMEKYLKGNYYITLAEKKLPVKELIKHIQEAHCYISLSREDSFGIPGLESLACGLPIITPEISGQSTYANEENGWKIKCNPTEHPRYEITPNLEHAKKTMRYVYTLWKENKDEWQIKKNYIKQFKKDGLFSWDKTIQKLDKIIINNLNK